MNNQLIISLGYLTKSYVLYMLKTEYLDIWTRPFFFLLALASGRVPVMHTGMIIYAIYIKIHNIYKTLLWAVYSVWAFRWAHDPNKKYSGRQHTAPSTSWSSLVFYYVIEKNRINFVSFFCLLWHTVLSLVNSPPPPNKRAPPPRFSCTLYTQ